MKPHIITLIIAFVAGYIGGVSNQLFTSPNKSPSAEKSADSSDFANPFQIDDESDDVVIQLAHLQQKVSALENQLSAFTSQTDENSDKPSNESKSRTNRSVSPNRENLLAAGVTPDIAEDVLRRISQQDYKRLELQNLIQRGGENARQYRDELRELNKNRLSLRTELGDDTYDQYLYTSGQNNRVKVSSVMADSPAEQAGFQTGDVIVYYDNQKILNWPDIRSATVEGEIGSYTNVEIIRDGARMNLMVPRGTLGVQLDPTQLDPAE